ncbi:MAG: hypothetical protein AAF591_17030 [Verrucomicrobiota bacterium]
MKLAHSLLTYPTLVPSIAVLAFLHYGVIPASAQNATTTSTANGDWFTPANWDNGVPSGTVGSSNVFVDSTLFLNTGTGTVNDRIIIGNGADGTLTVNGGILSTHVGSAVAGDDIIGNTGSVGVLQLDSGLAQFGDRALRVGDSNTDGTRGVINITGGTFAHTATDAADHIFVGDGNAGTVGEFNLSGGVATITMTGNSPDFRVGNVNGGSATLNITGGKFSFQPNNNGSHVQIGNGGAGFFNISAGTFAIEGGSGNGDLLFGGNLGGNAKGTGTISGSAFLSLKDDLTIGSGAGEAFVNMTGGTVAAQDVLVGTNVGSAGTLTVSSGLITTLNNFQVANGRFRRTAPNGAATTRGVGVVNLTGGTINVGSDTTGNFSIGNQTDSSGTLNQSGGLLTIATSLQMAIVGSLSSFDDGTGDVFPSVFGAAEGFANFSGGTTRIGDNVGNDNWVIGVRGLGSVNVSGTADIHNTNNIVLGSTVSTISTSNNGAGTGNGFLNVSGGTVGADNNIQIGNGGARGHLIVSGGTVGAARNILVGNSIGGLGSVTVTGGHVLSDANRDGLAANITLANNATATAFMTMSGGTVSAGEDFIVGASGQAILSHNGGVIQTGLGTDGMGADVAGQFVVGGGATGIGTAIVNGGTIVNFDTGGPNGQDTDHIVGLNGRGHLELRSGLIEVDGAGGIFVGQNTGSNGVYIQSGGVLDTGSGTSSPDIGEVLFASIEGSLGTGTISGGLVDTGTLNVGNGRFRTGVDVGGFSVASGNLTISGGTTIVAGQSFVGNNDDSQGILNISGGLNSFGNANNEDLRVAHEGQMAEDADVIGFADAYAGGARGILNISGGTNIIATNLEIAQGINNGQAITSLNGGGITTNGGAARGVVNISGGFTRVGNNVGGVRGAVVVGSTNGPDPTAASFATFNMSGGRLEVERFDVNVGANATNIANNVHNLTGGTIAPVSVANGGDGNIELDSNNTPFNINGSTLDLEGGNLTDANAAVNTLLITGGNVFNVNVLDAQVTMRGGTFQTSQDGVARVTSMENGATDHDFDGDTGTLIFDIFSDPTSGGGGAGTPGTDHSAIVDIDDISLLATIDIIVADPNAIGLTLDLGDEFDLLEFVSFDGGGTFISLPVLAPGLTWDTTTRWTSEGVIFIIPEPTPSLFLALAGSLFLRRRRKS